MAGTRDHERDHPQPLPLEERIPIVTCARSDPRLPARAATVGLTRSASRRLQATVALGLSALLAITVVAGTWAAPPPDGLDAPIRAFGWPSDGVPNDPFYSLQTDLPPIMVGPAWARTTGVPGVVVAVLDTGIDASNPEFAGRIVPGYNALTGIADGPADFAPTADDAGHGTHVSGTIAAAANNGMGMAGIAPNVSIMPIKVLSADGEGNFGRMIEGMNWAVGRGARIITMSLGGTLQPSAAASLQGTFTAAHAAGAIVIAASGNDSAAIDEYPCSFTYVICVGSATNDGTAVSTFSTRSAAVALVAPGERIASTLPGGGYGYGTGTSMATPHVTGAVALLRSLSPTLTPDEVLASLTQSARPLVDGGRNPDSGFGLLQVGAALDVATGVTPPGTPSPTPVATPTPSPSPSPTPTPDPGATPAPTPTPTSDPVIAPVPKPELIVPAVTASSPRNGARSVVRSIRPRLTFSVPVVGVSTQTIRMKDLSRDRWVAILVRYDSSTWAATIVPVVRLASNHSYRVIVSGVLTASAGTPLSRPFIVTFRTGYR